jgi:glycosyltransferase involved in cell wall biosynthesis
MYPTPDPDAGARPPTGEGSRVGVVIPVRNRPRVVLEALASVAAQDAPPHRVVVVDDGSTDGTAGAVAGWLARGAPPGWDLLRRRDAGAAAARNTGAAACPECDLLAFLDSDDLWPADFLGRARRALAGRPDASAATADRRRHDPHAGEIRDEAWAGLVSDPLLLLVERDAGIGSATVLRRQAFRQAGGYPESRVTGHDIVLFGRIAERGAWLHLPGAPVVFRRTAHLPLDGMDHIARTVSAPQFRWARLYDQVYRRARPHGGRARRMRRALAERWVVVAREALTAGHPGRAAVCLRRAVALRPRSRRLRRLWQAQRRGLPWA